MISLRTNPIADGIMACAPKPVILWSTPRSVSTAFERAMKNSPALDVLHEPYTDAYYFGPERKSTRYGDRNSVDYVCDRVEIEALIRSSPDGKRKFVKELAFQGEPYVSDGLLQDAIHMFITRHPRTVYASLVKLKPNFTEDEFGFTALQRLLSRLQYINSPPDMVINGDSFRAEPEATLRIACEIIDIRYDHAMLHWNNGKIRDWHSEEEKSQAVWHDTLENSSTILKPDSALPAVNILPQHYAYYEHALGIYQEIIYRKFRKGMT